MKTTMKSAIASLALAVAIGGGALASAALPANATTDSGTTQSSTTQSTQSTTQAARDESKGGHQANGITETLLTGDTATKETDAALAANPGATIQRVENDAEGATYEAHIIKSDGTRHRLSGRLLHRDLHGNRWPRRRCAGLMYPTKKDETAPGGCWARRLARRRRRHVIVVDPAEGEAR